MLRELLAPNASPMTLDGTRTFLVGRERVAVIDPGSADGGHLAALENAVGGGRAVAVLVTHRHPDHAAGAAELARRLDAPLRSAGRATLVAGERIATDAGDLVGVATPGHTLEHMALHWPAGRAVFCGDLMMGGLDTTLVAPPEGHLADYLASLERVRALAPAVIHPSHGPSFEDPPAALDAYARHRAERLEQVRAAVAAGDASVGHIISRIYEEPLPDALRAAARGAVEAYLAYLVERGEVAWPD
ncbi:MAG: MBL fold metallo-hydrolase [Gemmatimonadota bacterium]